jgi:AraC-like DNA-binding protein
MTIKYKKPSPLLSPFIDHFWEKNNPKEEIIAYETETVLPETYLNLTFSFGTPYFRSIDKNANFDSLNTPQIAALHTQPNYYKHQPDNHIFGVKFLPGGLYPFTQHSFACTSDLSLDMSQIFGSETAVLAEKLYDLNDFEARITCLENYLLGKINDRRLKKYNFVRLATQMLPTLNTDADISKLAERLNSNYKFLSRAFDEAIGISPKLFAQMQRFERSLQLISTQADNMNCTDIGYKSGYYDQAHFIREFKKFANMTPAKHKEILKNVIPNKQRNDFLQFLSPEHLLFYHIEIH